MLALLLLSACESSISTVIPLDEAGESSGDLQVSGSVDFGDVLIGGSGFATITLTNAGEGPLALQNLVLDADGVTMTQPALGGMTPGESVEILLTYTPGEVGCVSGNLRVTSDDPVEPVVSIPVLGCGVEEAVGTRLVELVLNFDDRWEAWIDGTSFTAEDAGSWYYADVVTWELPVGEHLLAIKGTNTGGGGALIGALKVDGTPVSVSGDGSWLMMDREPGDTWTTDGYDDSRWEAAVPCANENYGADQTGGADEDGAVWVSVTSECRDFSDGWFRVHFTVE